MNRLALACVMVLSFGTSVARGQIKWTPIEQGLELFDGSFADNGQTVTFILLRCDPRMNQVRVVDTYHEIGKENQLSAFSLSEVKNKTNAAVAVNAGSTSSFSFPAPVGLLQVNGRVVHAPNYEAKNAGVLCITQNRVSILPLLRSNPPRCSDAVQRGPILLRDLQLADSPLKASRRTVVAVDKEGRFLILVTRESATLPGLSSFLYSLKPGLNIQSALNLDGGVSSGLIFTLNGKTTSIGRIDGLIASAIVIYMKR